VLRINLNDFTQVETLPLGNVRAAVAIDFDLKNNSIFWSDVNRDHIMVTIKILRNSEKWID